MYNKQNKHLKPEKKVPEAKKPKLFVKETPSVTPAFHTTRVRDLNTNPKNLIENPGPGQYDLNFNEELKILDHKLSARYKKTPFGISSERFKLKEFQENIKNNKKREPTDDSKSFLNDDTLYQERKFRSEMVTEQLKKNEAARPSHMFKSQSSRFIDKRNANGQKQPFHAEVVNDNILIHEGNSLNKSRNRSQVMQKAITYGGQKVGFNILSPRFERDKNKFAPGPGEYLKEELNDEHVKVQHKTSKLLKKKVRHLKQPKMQTPHSYVGHDTLVKKSFNLLLTARSEE